jgi:hypothetical protein
MLDLMALTLDSTVHELDSAALVVDELDLVALVVDSMAQGGDEVAHDMLLNLRLDLQCRQRRRCRDAALIGERLELAQEGGPPLAGRHAMEIAVAAAALGYGFGDWKLGCICGRWVGTP